MLNKEIIWELSVDCYGSKGTNKVGSAPCRIGGIAGRHRRRGTGGQDGHQMTSVQRRRQRHYVHGVGAGHLHEVEQADGRQLGRRRGRRRRRPGAAHLGQERVRRRHHVGERRAYVEHQLVHQSYACRYNPISIGHTPGPCSTLLT